MNPLFQFFPLDDLSQEILAVSNAVTEDSYIRPLRESVNKSAEERNKRVARKKEILSFEKGDHPGPAVTNYVVQAQETQSIYEQCQIPFGSVLTCTTQEQEKLSHPVAPLLASISHLPWLTGKEARALEGHKTANWFFCLLTTDEKIAPATIGSLYSFDGVAKQYLLAPEGTLPGTPFSLDLFKPKAPSVDYSKPFAIWRPSNRSRQDINTFQLYHRWTPSLSEPASFPENSKEFFNSSQKWLRCAPDVKEGDRYRPDLYNQPDEDGWFVHDPQVWGKKESPLPRWLERAKIRLRAGNVFPLAHIVDWGVRAETSTEVIAWKPIF